MTLVYVQAAMDLQNTCNGLKLPDNFPDGWQQSSSSSSGRDENGDDMIIATSSFELNLSTSKMQRAVSASLSRIGFDHIEEHTITMKEMAQDYSIQIPPNIVEILSIDIANVEKMIAIEVDGPSHYVAKIDSPTIETCGFTKIVNGKLEYQFKWDGEQREMNGPTCLKQRLLKSLGWNIIHIPFWEWYALGGDSTKEDIYCRKLLE
jgi:RAP domain